MAMNSDKPDLGNAERKESSTEQLGVIFKPRNLLKTVSAALPGASSIAEILNQFEGHRIEKRLDALEVPSAELAAKLQRLEESQPRETVPARDWPSAVSEYVRRIVNIIVCYDGGVESPSQSGQELFSVIGHGCFVGPKAVLTCNESIEMAQEVARVKRGRVGIAAANLVRYDVEISEEDTGYGLAICRVTGRNEEDFQHEKAQREKYEKRGAKSMFVEPLETVVEFSISPWLGQEVGFLYTGEAPDISMWPKVQFDTAVISHFKKPTDVSFKTFVTGVLPSRFLYAGSPVFTRLGTLVGVIADAESYRADAGRRAVVRSLLGHPQFMKKSPKSP